MPANAIRKILSHMGGSTNPAGKSKRVSKGADTSLSVDTVNLVAKKGSKIAQSSRKTADDDRPAAQRSASDDSRATQPEMRRRTRSSSRSKPEEITHEPELSILPVSRSKRSGQKEAGEPAPKRMRQASQEVAAKASKSREKGDPPKPSRGKSRSKSAGRNVKSGSKPKPWELCSDFHVESNYTMVRPAYDSSKYNVGISQHDEESRNDPLEVADYVTDIYQHFFQAEV